MSHLLTEPQVLSLRNKKAKKSAILLFNASILAGFAAAIILTIVRDDCQKIDSVFSFPISDQCDVLNDPSVLRQLSSSIGSLDETGFIEIQYNNNCAPAKNVSYSASLDYTAGTLRQRFTTNLRSLLKCEAPNRISVSTKYNYPSRDAASKPDSACHFAEKGLTNQQYSLLQTGENRVFLRFVHCELNVDQDVSCIRNDGAVLGSVSSRLDYEHSVWRTDRNGLLDPCANNNGIRFRILNSSMPSNTTIQSLSPGGLTPTFGYATADGQFICPQQVCSAKQIQLGSYLGYVGLLLTITTFAIRWSPCFYTSLDGENSSSGKNIAL